MTGVLIHGTCVALDGAGVLLRGPSSSGKSDLALRLLHAFPVKTGFWPKAELVADDQTWIEARDGVLTACPPETIAGRMEVRGVGIIAFPYRSTAPLNLVADLDVTPPRLPDTPLETETILGYAVPRLAFDPAPASAPVRLALALRHLV